MEQNWLASADKPIRIEIWFGDHGIGTIRIYETNADQDLAVNDGGGSIALDLPADSTLADLSATAIAASGDLPVFIRLSQDGETLPADDGVDKINVTDAGNTAVSCGTAQQAIPLDFQFYVVRP